MNPVFTRIGILATGEHHEKCRGASSFAVHFLRKRFEVLRSLVDTSHAAKFYLYASPRAVRQANNRIRFQTALIAIVVHAAT